MYIIVAAVLIANIWVAVCNRGSERLKLKKIGDALLADWRVVLLSIADAVILLLAVIVICIFQTRWYLRVGYILLGILMQCFLMFLMAGQLNWKRFLTLAFITALVWAGFRADYQYDQYISTITMNDYFDYRTYTPFVSGSLAKETEQDVQLRFEDTDTLPRMDGATALYPVYAAFAQATYPEAMKDKEPEQIRKIVACSTTANAYRKIVKGECDIIFVAGPSREQEEYVASQGVELVYTPIDREAFVFFVHPDNPVEGLTIDEIRSVYSGSIDRWDQLGVRGLGRILAYQRDEGSGSQTALERFVMRDTPIMPAIKENVAGDMGDIISRVSAYRNHRNALGYSFRFYCTELMKNFDVKILSINGIAPTVENIENGTYPLASYFYAVTRSDAGEETRVLLEWICGSEGQQLVKKCGYSPVGPAY